MAQVPWLTLRELDEAAGMPKGTAFRAFKALEPRIAEGRDFRLLDATRDAAEITALRPRSYRSSRNLLLISPDAAELLLSQMR